ncbi:MAG: acyltransferase [Gemmatimonadaceae bacterium]|nr:acyltransferase [Gemmatimonadaceae bacterium]
MPEPDSAIRRDIDGLRALAVLLVIAHHVAPAQLTGGFIGVDVFFVISGFLITRIIDSAMFAGTFDYVEFLWKRCRRILPSLLVVLVGTLLMGACVLTGPELVSLARHVVAGSLFSSNLLLWNEVGYFDTSALGKPLLHLWSLGIEEQFYLVWPVFLTLLPLNRRIRLLSVIALVALSLLISENLAYSDPSQGFYMLHSRAWELGVGGLIALAGPMVPATLALPVWMRAQLRSSLSAVGLTMILVAALHTDGASSWPGITALVPVVGTVLVIVAGPDALLNRTLLSIRPAEWVGQRSYALYLWHWPPIALMHILAAERNVPESTQVWIAAALMLPALALAHATLHHVERPVRQIAARVEERSRILVRHLLPFGVAIAILAMTAHTVMRSHGIPSRYGTAGDDALATLRAASADSITAYDRHATRCRLADKGNATWCWRIPGRGKGIAVFGDSHAEVVFAGLADLDAHRPLFLTGRKGCAPILQPDSIADRFGEICRRASQLAHAAVRSDSSISTVLLVSRGPAYITGAGFGVDTQRPVVPVAVRTSLTDTLALARAFDAGLEQSVQSFVDAGKRVILVVGVPEIGFLPEECLIGRPFGLRDVREPCAVSRAVVDHRNKEYRRLVGALAARIPQLEIFDAESIFCDGALCHARRGRQLLYQDGNHLTMLGSRLISARLRTVLGFAPPKAALAAATPVF